MRLQQFVIRAWKCSQQAVLTRLQRQRRSVNTRGADTPSAQPRSGRSFGHRASVSVTNYPLLVRDLKRLMHANMEEEIDRFVSALEEDQILPEDF